MQYKVPQNIDLEDKIVGPFTMKQFIYLLVGGTIIYGWWNYANTYVDPSPMSIFIPLALPVGLLTFCLALVKVNDRPFELFLLNIFKFIFSPKQRMWREGFKEQGVIVIDKNAEKQTKQGTVKDTSSLDDLAKTLEKQANLISQNTPQAKPDTTGKGQSQAETKNLNISVKDVAGASKKQAEAQTGNKKPSGGLFGIFKK
jgi:hypothetical protein